MILDEPELVNSPHIQQKEPEEIKGSSVVSAGAIELLQNIQISEQSAPPSELG